MSKSEKGLFPPGREIRFFNASGRRDEVWYAAKEILKLVEKEGYRFRDIAVVARSLDEYGPVVKEVFGENAVPFVSSCQVSLNRYPLVKVIRELISLPDSKFLWSAVMDSAALLS